MLRPRLLAGTVLAATLVLTGCLATAESPPPPPTAPPGAYACPPGDLLVEGPPVDHALLESHVVGYSEQCRNSARVTVSTERDGGRASFVNGLVHLAAADSTLTAEQSEKARIRCLDNPAWHLPTATDPVALVHRVDGVDRLSLGPVTLAKIFSGMITHWNDPAIAAENPETELPDARIEVFYRAGQTGTTGALSDYLHREAPEYWPARDVQSWRGQGQGRETSAQILEAVRTTPFALGYVEYSALPPETASPTPTPSPSPSVPSAVPSSAVPSSAVPSDTATPQEPTPTTRTTPATVPPRLVLLSRAGTSVALTPETAQHAVSDIAALGAGPDLRVDPGSLAADTAGWPIHRVSYQILCSAGLRAEWTALEKDWVSYLLSDETQGTLAATGRVALPPEFREQVRASLGSVR
jgi:phosphate transport system substrate-binding protein